MSHVVPDAMAKPVSSVPSVLDLKKYKMVRAQILDYENAFDGLDKSLLLSFASRSNIDQNLCRLVRGHISDRIRLASLKTMVFLFHVNGNCSRYFPTFPLLFLPHSIFFVACKSTMLFLVKSMLNLRSVP